MLTDTAATRAGGILTIDLPAIQANYRRLRQELGDVPCAAVLKADGYGLGDTVVGPALRKAGARTFFVALPDEGIRLRRALPDVPIFILGGLFKGAEEEYLHNDLLPVLNSLEEVERWAALARQKGNRLGAAIQTDSGMSRLGMPDSEILALHENQEILSSIELRLIMSHLACADEPAHLQNREQLQSFQRARRLFPEVPASLANSSGIFLGKDYHFELGRPGAALYGVNPTPAQASPMRPVVRLQAKVLQVRSIDAGRSVGYGAAFRAKTKSRIATLALGYADSFLRHLSDRGFAWYQGIRLPLAGRVSMDVAGLDITALPEGSLQPGDLVDILGPDQGVDELAAQAGTIGYEILTSLGRRYHRIYRSV